MGTGIEMCVRVCVNAFDEARVDNEIIAIYIAEFSNDEVVEDLDTFDAYPKPNTEPCIIQSCSTCCAACGPYPTSAPQVLRETHNIPSIHGIKRPHTIRKHMSLLTTHHVPSQLLQY